MPTKEEKPRGRPRYGLIVAVAAVMLVGMGLPRNGGPTNNEPSGYAPPAQTKTQGCTIAGSLPDKACTPGTVFAGATSQQVCAIGYAASVRDVSASLKQAIYAAYGITEHQAREYQVDHLISLELGGSNESANLWPQPANLLPGYHQKDQLENYLHNQVCSGKLSLAEAQERIATDWAAAYQKAGLGP